MSKVTVVGAGNVGATCANVIATREIADELVLLDIKEGVSEGKMLDIFQTATLMDFDTKLTGVTNDYAATANSDVVVVTSGMPRKPGMTREELIGVNAGIVASVVGNILKYSPKAIIVMISNPMDTMTYLALKKTGLPKNQLFGMGGATLTKLLGTSAWYAPGAAGAYVVESIIRDQKKVVPCCAYLEGEYGQQDICIGVPVVLGKNGVEKVLELNLNADEKALFEKSAEAVRKTNAILKEIKAL